MKLKFKNNPRNLVTSLILVFPLFLIYQLGVVLIYPMINGADFLTRFLFQNLALSRSAYLGYTAAVAALFAITVAVLRRHQKINLSVFVPVLLESAIYALTMGSVIVLVMTRVFGINPRLGAGLALPDQGLVTRMVMSVGAGVWEETTFRLGLLTGITVLCERVIGMRRPIAVVLALGVSSVLFSAVHHIPPTAIPFSWAFSRFAYSREFVSDSCSGSADLRSPCTRTRYTTSTC